MKINLNNQFHKILVPFADYLQKVLPKISANWWQECVVNALSFQQQRIIKEREIDSLSKFDLAALLRIIDQNWYQISRLMNLTSEARHFVKEMQTIRNRWAHIGSEEFPTEDIYRDLDTLQRFARVIGAEKDIIDEIQETKNLIISDGNPILNDIVEDEEMTEEETKATYSEFKPGQIVHIVSDPSIKGAIVSLLTSEQENRYQVFINGEIHTYYASQLREEKNLDNEYSIHSLSEFHSYLTSLQIKYPGLATLYSLNAARVDFIPYQFRPVLRFIRSDRPRMLIADSVGVGKTIEAGLILRELQARRDVKSILIICPRPLVTEHKWQIEMKRFEERFTHLDGKNLRHCINEMDLEGVWPDNFNKAIIPYSLFDESLLYGIEGKRKNKKGLLQLDPPPKFDLVIVDEAHHIRNQKTFRSKAVRFFCDNAEAVIFLTATPIQLGNNDLFVLLNTLRPDLVIDKESFEHMSEPNPHINNAVSCLRLQGPDWANKTYQSLNKAENTSWGRSIFKHNPKFRQVSSLLSKGDVSQDQRIQLITDIEELNTFSGIINRTRRRDIGNFTVRKPETIYVEFTPKQQEIHDRLLQIQAEIFSRLHEDVNIKFMMTTIRRQAASCIFGLVPLLEEILSRHIDELAWVETDDYDIYPDDQLIGNIESRINELLLLAKDIDKYDPKLEALQNVVKSKQNMSNNKLMLFSSFRHTLYYLYDHLTKDGFRVGLIHGGIPDEERMELKKRFELSSSEQDCLDIMLFSEVGCEGLDYQFCDCMINYDLPWNPMRIEQRIGRIDRNGQKSESVVIYNFITPGTVDADIYERCLIRIGVFNNALGGGEEILGQISKEIRDIAQDFLLSDKERKEKLQQLSDNKIRLIQEQEMLEEKQLELFGIRLPQEQINKEIANATNFWLSPLSLQRLVSNYLQNSYGSDQEYILGEKLLKTLRLSQDARNVLLKEFQKLARRNNPMYRQWENWLKGSNQHLNVTFESECASQNPKAAFL
ncbi:MAG: Swt1 family HEPN domain-containing protein, partial [Candidatus Stygibacter australis]|nr:Swt1 family HEPN domain-containing protein [Candidatus Stygibacter australis]